MGKTSYSDISFSELINIFDIVLKDEGSRAAVGMEYKLATPLTAIAGRKPSIVYTQRKIWGLFEFFSNFNDVFFIHLDDPIRIFLSLRLLISSTISYPHSAIA